MDTDEIIDAYTLPDTAAHPADIAARLMLLPEHRHLSDNDVQFGWLMRCEPKEKGGKVELGSVHAVKTMFQGGFKDLGLQMLDRMLGLLPQFVVVINAPWWEQAEAIDREALVYHELLHVKQALDSYGAPKFDKDGFPVWQLVSHDIEAFTSEVQRYGAWKDDLQQFMSATRNT